MNGWPGADAGATGRARRERRRLVVTALAVQAAVLVAVAVDAPFAARLPLGLLYVAAVPGFAVVGLLRLAEPATEVALSVVVSLLLCTATAQVLVWAGHYSLGATLAVLGVLATSGLVAQLGARHRFADGADVATVPDAAAAAAAAGTVTGRPRPGSGRPRPRSGWP